MDRNFKSGGLILTALQGYITSTIDIYKDYLILCSSQTATNIQSTVDIYWHADSTLCLVCMSTTGDISSPGDKSSIRNVSNDADLLNNQFSARYS